MALEFPNGTLRDMIAHVTARVEEIGDNAETIMENVIDRAEQQMVKNIETATTPTGERRASGVPSGPRDAGHGIPGRVESGEMRDDVTSDVKRDGDVIEGSFGWLDGIQERYRYQEDGTEFIQPMHALLNAFIDAEQDLAKEMRDVASAQVKES